MTGWTQERADLCAKLWREGLSTATIARQLGGTTKNAVIGKIHRMGLQGQQRQTRLKPAVQNGAQAISMADRIRAKRKAAKAEPDKPPAPAQGGAEPDSAPAKGGSEPEGEPITLLELRNDDCRWPVSDVDGLDTLFCGAKAELGGPYCEHHTAKATGKQPQGRTKPARREA